MESSELGHVLVAMSLTLLHEECKQGEMVCVSACWVVIPIRSAVEGWMLHSFAHCCPHWCL